MTAPAPPTNLVAVPTLGGSAITLSFTASTDPLVVSYTIYALPNINPVTVEVSDPVNITGLTNGVAYTFFMTAMDLLGSTSVFSTNSNTVIPGDVPDPPTDVIATVNSSDGSVNVSFTPANDGGYPISVFTCSAIPDPTYGGQIPQSSSSGTTINMTGLTNGLLYTFTVTATNAIGVSDASVASNQVLTLPDPPTNVIATAGDSSAILNFTPPQNLSYSFGLYTVQIIPSGGETFTTTFDGTLTTYEVTGLTNGLTYTFEISASNDSGNSQYSHPSNNVIPIGIPSAPRAFRATRGNRKAVLTWQPPLNNGGIPINSYTLSVVQNTTTVYIIAGTVNTFTLNGLTNGLLYTLTLTATNGVLQSPPVSTTVTPSTTPHPPTINSVAAANQSVIVSYTPPTDNGGDAITQYVASATAGLSVVTVSQFPPFVNSITIPGLVNGTSYTITLYAKNSVDGQSETAAYPTAVIPVSIPNAPTGVTATQIASQTLRISWSAPTNTGGSPLSSYEVEYLDQSIPVVIRILAPTTNTIIAGLLNGAQYTFTVYAFNTVLPTTRSLPSSPVSIIPTGPSDPPTDVTVLRSGTAGALSITFVPPTFTGGADIVSYTVYAYNCDGGTPGTLAHTFEGIQNGATLTGYTFTNGNFYCFTAITVNSSPFGLPSSASAPSSAIQAGTIPLAPTLTVTPTPPDGNLFVQLAYNSNGGIPITGFSGYLSNATYFGPFSSGTPESPFIALSGLNNGAAYYATAFVTNAVGDSLYSSNVIGIPSRVPDAPAIGSAVAGHNRVSVSLTPNGDGGAPITSYTAIAYISGNPPTPTGITATALGPPIVITGLTNDVFYTFTVAASNLQGNSAESAFSLSVKPFITVPDSPIMGIVLPRPSGAVLTFTPPYDDGGTPITSYTIYNYPGPPGNIVGTTTIGSPFTVTGLTNGTEYQFAVSATNAQGNSLLSGYSTRFIAANVPSYPRFVNAVPLDRQIRVHFTEPSSNGGSPILYYTVFVEYNSTLQRVTGTSSPILITGLTNGFPYIIRMSATNAIGESALTPLPAFAMPTGTLAGLGANALYPVGKWGSQVPISLGTDISGADISGAVVSGAVAIVAGPDESVYVAYASIGFTTEQSLYNIILAHLDSNGNVLWIMNDPQLQTNQDSFTPVLSLDATRSTLYLAFGTTGNVPARTNMADVPVFNPVSCIDPGYNDLVLAQITIANNIPTVSWVKQDGYLNSCNNERNPQLVYDPVNEWIYIAYEATGPLEAYQFPSYAPAPLPSGGTQVVLSAFDVNGNRVGILQNYFYDNGTTRNYINCNGNNTNPTITVDISGNVFITLNQTVNTRTDEPFLQGPQIEILKVSVTDKTVRPVAFTQQLFNDGESGYGPFYDNTREVLMPQITGGGGGGGGSSSSSSSSQPSLFIGFLKNSQYYLASFPTSFAQVYFQQTGIYNHAPYAYSSVLYTNTTVDFYGRPFVILKVVNSVGDVWILMMRLDPTNGEQVYSDGYGSNATWNIFPFAFSSTPLSRRSLPEDPQPNIPGYGLPAVACFQNTVFIAVPSPYLFLPGAFYAQPMLSEAPSRYMSVGAYNQLTYDPNITAFNYLKNYRSFCSCGAGMCTCN